MKKITSFFKTIKTALIKCKTNDHFTAYLCAQPVPASLLASIEPNASAIFRPNQKRSRCPNEISVFDI